MRILATAGKDDLAKVYIAEINGKKIEFVESIQPPLTREEKWVLIISTLYGCPVDCGFCDAGGNYGGIINKDGLLAQIDFLIKSHYPNKIIPAKKFKIQFSRMGEPAFNPHVIEVLRELPNLYEFKNFLPSVSTVAPVGREGFFEELKLLKKSLYDKNFQLQFSIHSTNEEQRNSLIPIKKWSFPQIANYAEDFYTEGGKKITLNFAVAEDSIIEPNVLLSNFDPEKFLIKLTPVNPTHKALKNNIKSNVNSEIKQTLQDTGYKVIMSIGELEENNIGSNCGQYINNLKQGLELGNSYSYEVKRL